MPREQHQLSMADIPAASNKDESSSLAANNTEQMAIIEELNSLMLVKDQDLHLISSQLKN